MAKKKAKKKPVKKVASRAIKDSIKDALKYPWAKMQRAFWFWLIIIPIFGWFPLYGYIMDIIQNIVKGNDRSMPKFGRYWKSFTHGFYYFLFSIILAIVMGILMRIPLVGWIIYIYVILITPILVANYAVKRRFGAFFDVGLATKMVFGNFIAYIVVFLKTIVTILFWVLCSIPIITLIWTIPALQFSSQFLIAQFYRKFK
ncbi:DUF4013 domain-containing protein [Candidatus Woesearchaeota archaeon]|nr:DUF4013 domain-containing protein [Candidatus Woesearchaeota archaeon]